MLDQDYTGIAGPEITDVSLTTTNVIASFYDANAGYVPMVTNQDDGPVEEEADFNGRIITILGNNLDPSNNPNSHVAPYLLPNKH